ncbi:unnamed protein product [Ilex paraguariensis]|uniref:Transposase n=1 Tax=Ilex paraguariensis TaxID=185542 RepID=A0ABC8SU90_9AQUA
MKLARVCGMIIKTGLNWVSLQRPIKPSPTEGYVPWSMDTNLNKAANALVVKQTPTTWAGRWA